jgi:hypothetical protein
MNKTLEIIHNSDIDFFIRELKISEIDYFSLSIVKKNKVLSVISLNEWQNFYVDRQCFDFDPLVNCALATVKTPIDWKSVNINKKKSAFIMRSRMEITGCNEGVTMSQTVGDDTHMIFSLATYGSFNAVLNGYLKHQTKILNLAEQI